MFFIASKALWFFAAPSALLILGALIGAAFSARRSGQLLALACLAMLLVVGAAPLGALLIAPLENRFPRAARQPAAALRRRRARRRNRRRHQPRARPNDLRRRRGAPDRNGDPRPPLSFGAHRLQRRQQLSPRSSVERGGGSAPPARRDGRRSQRITLESRSRNTDENARFTAAIVHPEAGQAWLVVTSAYHMPRAMGLFRKAGFDAVAVRSTTGPRAAARLAA